MDQGTYLIIAFLAGALVYVVFLDAPLLRFCNRVFESDLDDKWTPRRPPAGCGVTAVMFPVRMGLGFLCILLMLAVADVIWELLH